MIPGDFQYRRPTGRDLVKLGILGGVATLLGIAALFGLVLMISAWLGQPVVFGGNAPEQPIAFPHTRHVQDLGLDCTFCHRTVTTQANASVPSVGLCAACHLAVGSGIPEVERLRAEYIQTNKPIDWVRVHRVPDHVHFVHEAHVRFFSQQNQVEASGTCAICHGNVAQMTKVEIVRPLKMGDCVDCHRDNGAPTDCTTCHF